jgi:hypothetical protein
MIRVFHEELNRHVIYKLNNSNGQPVHITCIKTNIYAASGTDLNIGYDIFNSFGCKISYKMFPKDM